VDADLGIHATALCGKTDDLLKESPKLAPWRPAAVRTRCLAARGPRVIEVVPSSFIRRLAAAAVARAPSRHSHIPSDPSFHGWAWPSASS
jgi:hypothetical protein